VRPIAEIAEAARRIHSSTLDNRIQTPGLPAEVAALAETFNTMIAGLEDSFGRLSRFSADIAHELRTPVNNLRGEAEVALRQARTPEEYRSVLGSLLEESVRLSRTIDSLLFVARAESPETQISRETLNVAHELNVVTDFYEAVAAEAGVRLIVEADEKLLASFDRMLWQRAIGNLVANALDHTPPGGCTTVRAHSDDGQLRVEIADTGCGIPAEHLPHVFDRFYRVDPSRSGHSPRLGLGLALVKSIVGLHGGSVDIASELGRGTTVTLRIPQHDFMTIT
jgi:two-component system heavy metal sensor histidine kinase CusS